MALNPQQGFRVIADIDRLPREVVQGFAGWATGNVCDALGRVGAMDYQIKPLDPSWRFVGSALTVRARPVDNLIVYKALEIARPGDVLTIATGSATTASVFGDLVCAIARAKGVAALVTDGVVRDAAGIREVGVPVFTRGLSPNSPYKDGPGDINLPISCGGVPVQPGDVILGDEDGVVVVPRDDAIAVLEALPGIRAKERTVAREIAAGRLIPGSLIEALASKGWQIST